MSERARKLHARLQQTQLYAVACYKRAYYIVAMRETFGFLISDTSRALRRRFDERARQIGVTRTQWRVLSALARNEGINQGGLADLMEVEPITLGRMIDRLEDAGLVERRRAPTDRRAWNIYLTDKARPLLDQLRAIAATMTADALDGITADDLAVVTATLTRVRANLQPSDIKEAAHG